MLAQLQGYRTAVGMSKNTVRKYIHELEYKELISCKATTYEFKDGQIRNGNLEIKILPIQQAVNFYNERQLWE